MKKILVIKEFDSFSQILLNESFEIISLPLIKTKPLDDLSDFDLKLEKIDFYDGIFITSKNAAKLLKKVLSEKKISFAGKIYILGKSSYNILKSTGSNIIFNKDVNTAEEMLENIPFEEIEQKKFLFIRGEKSLKTIPNYLENVCELEEVIVYRTDSIVLEGSKIKEINDLLKNCEIECVSFFSPSGFKSFIDQIGIESLSKTKVSVIGKTTGKFIQENNIAIDFVSPKTNKKEFAKLLVKFLKN